MQRSSEVILRIHIRAIGDKQVNDFFVTSSSRCLQRSQTMLIFRIHIRAISDVLFDGFDVSFTGSYVN